MAHRGQELNARLLLQTDDPPPIGSSTEQGITKASGNIYIIQKLTLIMLFSYQIIEICPCFRIQITLERGSRTQGKQTRWNTRNVELDRRVNAHGRIRIEIEKRRVENQYVVMLPNLVKPSRPQFKAQFHCVVRNGRMYLK